MKRARDITLGDNVYCNDGKEPMTGYVLGIGFSYHTAGDIWVRVRGKRPKERGIIGNRYYRLKHVRKIGETNG